MDVKQKVKVERGKWCSLRAEKKSVSFRERLIQYGGLYVRGFVTRIRYLIDVKMRLRHELP
jgi:hypothetical protein